MKDQNAVEFVQLAEELEKTMEENQF